MFVLESLELGSHDLYDRLPLLLERVVLLELQANMAFVFLVVGTNFALSLLEDLNLKSALSRPLLAQVFIKLLDRFVLEVFDFLSYLLLIQLVFSHDPSKCLVEALF